MSTNQIKIAKVGWARNFMLILFTLEGLMAGVNIECMVLRIAQLNCVQLQNL